MYTSRSPDLVGAYEWLYSESFIAIQMTKGVGAANHLATYYVDMKRCNTGYTQGLMKKVFLKNNQHRIDILLTE
jgi:hypothetical protein